MMRMRMMVMMMTIGTLRSNDADDNVNVKKNNRFNRQNNNFARASHFLYISFSFLHDYDVKMPNFAFYGGRKQVTAKFYFSFRAWLWPASEGFVYNWQSKWEGIIAIKTERTQIHFLRGVLVAVASLDL